MYGSCTAAQAIKNRKTAVSEIDLLAKDIVPGLYVLYLWEDADVFGLGAAGKDEWIRKDAVSLGKVKGVEGRWADDDCKLHNEFCPTKKKGAKSGKGKEKRSEVQPQAISVGATFNAKFVMKIEKMDENRSKYYSLLEYHVDIVGKERILAINLCLTKQGKFCQKSGDETFGLKSTEVVEHVL